MVNELVKVFTGKHTPTHTYKHLWPLPSGRTFYWCKRRLCNKCIVFSFALLCVNTTLISVIIILYCLFLIKHRLRLCHLFDFPFKNMQIKTTRLKKRCFLFSICFHFAYVLCIWNHELNKYVRPRRLYRILAKAIAPFRPHLIFLFLIYFKSKMSWYQLLLL